MFNILDFFRSIYVYISTKIRSQKSNVSIYDSVSDGEDNVIDDDAEYEIFISNIHTAK
jgi:hypothetical protein